MSFSIYMMELYALLITLLCIYLLMKYDYGGDYNPVEIFRVLGVMILVVSIFVYTMIYVSPRIQQFPTSDIIERETIENGTDVNRE